MVTSLEQEQSQSFLDLLVDNIRLADSLRNVEEVERGIRFHLDHVGEDAAEQARGQVAYRHAVALRMALGNWVETRAYRAAKQE